MPAPVSCPPNFELEQFLLGRLEDEDSTSLEFHLANCTVCQRQLTTALRIHSKQVAAGEAAPRLDDAPEELVQLLVPHFKRIASSFEETATFSSRQLDPNALTKRGAVFGQPASEPALPPSLGRYEIQGELGHGGNGYFAVAFLKALEVGQGVPYAPHDHALYTHHIYAVVFSEVRRATTGRQNPFLNMPWTVPPLALRAVSQNQCCSHARQSVG